MRLGGLEINTHRQTVTRSDVRILLSKTEWQLLAVLVSYEGEPALDSELLIKVWGPDYRNDVRYLRTWIARLRSKLDGGAQETILDFHGVGSLRGLT